MAALEKSFEKRTIISEGEVSNLVSCVFLWSSMEQEERHWDSYLNLENQKVNYMNKIILKKTILNDRKT